MKYVLILPNQLFENCLLLNQINQNDQNDQINQNNESDQIILYEHPLYFTKFKYHKMKLVMHRATMKFYYNYLIEKYNIKKNNIRYIDFNKNIKSIFKKNDEIYIYNPLDHEILEEINSFNCKVNMIDNPGHICSINDFDEYLSKNVLDNKLNEKSFSHHSFYIWFRKKYTILMNKDKPLGNKWSFDKENRLSFPKNKEEEINSLDNYLDKNKNKDKYLVEAKIYVNKHFQNNHGSDEYYLPITFEEAKMHFKKFIKDKLNNFGPYEDAVNSEITFGYHSIMSPIINIGLITPKFIIDYLIKNLDKLKNIKIQSIEGYIRQLFWREFCIFVYLYKNKELENGNFFNHKNKINHSWYNATTQFGPINNIIQKALNYGWCHHIERLMYLGNIFLLLQINPKNVYKWFMELFIDAYPWVMSPNVYGMSQFSAGNIMMKRPYFSSTNYLFKLSNYKKIKYEKIILNNENYDWSEIWNSLYYNFIDCNKLFLSKNYSTANMVSIFNKKSKIEKEKYKNISNLFIEKYL